MALVRATRQRNRDQRDLWNEWHARNSEGTGWSDVDAGLVDRLLCMAPRVSLPILDLGCGQCTSALYDSRRAESVGAVIAIDFADRALQFAAERIPQNTHRPVALKKADISEPLSLPDASVRAVYAHLSLHYFDDATTQRLFEEVHRVCVPGGVLGLAVKSTRDERYGRGYPLGPDMFSDRGHVRHFFSGTYLTSLLQKWELMETHEVTARDPEASAPSTMLRAVVRRRP